MIPYFHETLIKYHEYATMIYEESGMIGAVWIRGGQHVFGVLTHLLRSTSDLGVTTGHSNTHLSSPCHRFRHPCTLLFSSQRVSSTSGFYPETLFCTQGENIKYLLQKTAWLRLCGGQISHREKANSPSVAFFLQNGSVFFLSPRLVDGVDD